MASGPSRTLTLRYASDTSRFSKGNKQAQSGLQKLGKSFAKFGKVAGVGAAAAGVAAIAVAKKLFEAGEAAATANARITNIAESMDLFGHEAGTVSGRLVDLANTQAKLTGVSRNTIKETSALLLTFRSVASSADEVGGVFDRAQEAALDLAAAGFGTATSNAQSLGKALENPIKGLTSLTRQGVTFTDAERERIKTLVESNKVGEAQELILAAIEQQVGGTAEATANASEKLRESFGVLVDQVALALAPVFEKLVDVAARVIERLQELWTTHGPRIIDFVQRATSRFRDWWNELSERFGPVLRDLIARLKDFITSAREWWQRVSPGVLSAFRTLRAPVLDVFNAVKNLWGSVKALFGAFRNGESDGRGFETFIRILVGAVRLLLSAFESFIRLIDRVVGALKKLVDSKPFQLALSGLRAIASGIDRVFGGGDEQTPPPTPAPPPPPPPRPDRLPSVPLPPDRRGGTVININTGIGDPSAIAREVDRVTRNETARAGSQFIEYAPGLFAPA